MSKYDKARYVIIELKALGQRFFYKGYAGQPIGIKSSYKATQRQETVNLTLSLTVKCRMRDRRKFSMEITHPA
jgi:hypothetical protein